MREILFRAKRKDNGEWIEGYYVKSNFKRAKDRHYITCCQPETRSSYCGNYTMQVKIEEIIPETISQYTGLTDKNGVKIFENDNLKMFQIDYDSETENGYGESTFEYKEVHIKASLDFIYSYQLYEEFLDDIEVIGNIFDEEVK